MTPIQKVPGIGQTLATVLAGKGIQTAEQLAETSPNTLMDIPRFGVRRIANILAAARQTVVGNQAKVEPATGATMQSDTIEETAPVAPDEGSAPVVKKGKNPSAPKKASAKAAKKTDAKKTDAKKTDAKKTDAKKTDAKKTVKKKKTKKKADAKKTKKKAAKSAKSKPSGAPKDARTDKVTKTKKIGKSKKK